MVHCLGLLAEAGHGKTTAAKYLVEAFDAQIVSLATPLKRCAQKVMKFTDAQLWGTQEQKDAIDPRYGFSARYFLQSLGTEGLREEFWPSIHLDAFEKALELRASALSYQPLFVCDDVRFRNEAKFLACPPEAYGPYPSSRSSAVIKIICTDAPKMPGSHTSEAEINSIPPEHIAETIITSRAQGVEHLHGEIRRALAESPNLTLRLFRSHSLLTDGLTRVSRGAA